MASDEDQVRSTAKKATEALLSDHPERSCAYTVDREKCIGGVVTAKGMNLDMAAVTGYADGWEKRLEQAKVTVKGDTATIEDFSGDGKDGRWVRRNGKWLGDNR